MDDIIMKSMFVDRSVAELVVAIMDANGVRVGVSETIHNIDPYGLCNFGEYGHESYIKGNMLRFLWMYMVEMGKCPEIRPEFLYSYLFFLCGRSSDVIVELKKIKDSWDLYEIFENSKQILELVGRSDDGYTVALYYLFLRSVVTGNFIVLRFNPFIEGFDINSVRWEFE